MKGLKKVKLIYHHLGENATTPRYPFSVATQEIDLDETVLRCTSADFDMLVEIKRYEVRDIFLPRWMDPKTYIDGPVQWQYLWGLGADPTWPKRWQIKLATLGSIQKLACIKLLKTKTFRSNFRRSLRDQLEIWLASKSAKRHISPFSPKQWQALLDPHTCREAESVASALYNRREYHGIPVLD